jgi:hypothetical protein
VSDGQTVREFAGGVQLLDFCRAIPDRLDVTRKEVDALGGKAIAIVGKKIILKRGRDGPIQN